jgi:hypothetical protein
VKSHVATPPRIPIEIASAVRSGMYFPPNCCWRQ